MRRRGFLKFLGAGALATAATDAHARDDNVKIPNRRAVYEEGQALTIGPDGKWRPADCLHDTIVCGIATRDGVTTAVGSIQPLQFDEFGPDSSHVGDNVYLAHDGRVSLFSPLKGGIAVVRVGILMDADGRVLFQPQFISRKVF